MNETEEDRAYYGAAEAAFIARRVARAARQLPAGHRLQPVVDRRKPMPIARGLATVASSVSSGNCAGTWTARGTGARTTWCACGTAARR